MNPVALLLRRFRERKLSDYLAFEPSRVCGDGESRRCYVVFASSLKTIGILHV